MKAVVTVIGLDSVGILARVSSVCAEHNANVIDVTQSVMQKLFTMIMMAKMFRFLFCQHMTLCYTPNRR